MKFIATLKPVALMLSIAVIGTAAAFFGELVVSGVLNYTGRCSVTGRYLTDEEKIAIAVDDVYRSYPPVVDLFEKNGPEYILVGRDLPEKVVKYESVDDFLAKNKNCCAVSDVGRKGYEASLEYRLIGSLSDFVRVTYDVKYEDSDGDVVVYKEEVFVAISNCGRPWSGS